MNSTRDELVPPESGTQAPVRSCASASEEKWARYVCAPPGEEVSNFEVTSPPANVCAD
jgi:hypothetical protein